MLKNSFIFIPGITEENEKELWRKGVINWDILEKYNNEAVSVVGDKKAKSMINNIAEIRQALENNDNNWFVKNWPIKESWRLWKDYCPMEEIALVDIETTGRTPGYDQITVIGLSDGEKEIAFVSGNPQKQDKQLEDYLSVIKKYKLFVSYNGVSFDVPFIEKHFVSSSYKLEQPHLDLIWPARSLGLKGGLKDMEKQIGIARSSDIAEVRGNEAISLWGDWQSKADIGAYEKLVRYCLADCTNLKAFADHVYSKKREELFDKNAIEIDFEKEYGKQGEMFDPSMF